MRTLMIVALAVLAAGCGGGRSAGSTYQPSAAHDALSNAGWSVMSAPGMKPVFGGRQLGWLNATSPARTKLSLQFLESPDLANRELSAVQKRDPGFEGKTVGSILVFVAPNGRQPVPSADLKALTQALQ